MANDKYGFVYIWYNSWKQKYYIGCHWGNETDGYVCSSKSMRESHKRNPQNFKRRILKKIYTNKQDLLEEEHKWLSLIKDSELGKKYYNLTKKHFGHWSATDNALSIGQKISASPLRRQRISDAQKGKVISQEQRDKMSLAKKGKKLTDSHKENIRLANLRMGSAKYTPEMRAKMSEIAKRKPKETLFGGKKYSYPGMIGLKHSEEAKQKMSASQKEYFKTHKHPNKGKPMSEEQKKKISETLKNKYK